MICNFFTSIDWQTVANVTTSVALILAILAFGWEIRVNRKTQEFSVFMKFVDAYQKIIEDRHKIWAKITHMVRSNPKTKNEIPDKTNSINYLLLRIKQAEHLYAVEQELIEYELESINLLNELCRYSLVDGQKELLTKALFASEISFYQNRIEDIISLRKQASKERTLSIVRYDSLMKFQVGDFFGGEK